MSNFHAILNFVNLTTKIKSNNKHSNTVEIGLSIKWKLFNFLLHFYITFNFLVESNWYLYFIVSLTFNVFLKTLKEKLLKS